MFSRQEHRNDDQIICWNCEETVHESSSVCPYCNVDLGRHPVQKAPEQTKITLLPLTPNIQKTRTEEPSAHQYSETSIGQTFRFLGSLFLLLGGTSLLFIATLIAFFSTDGAFTISWPEHSWSAFFGLGLSLVAFGTLVFQKLSASDE